MWILHDCHCPTSTLTCGDRAEDSRFAVSSIDRDDLLARGENKTLSHLMTDCERHNGRHYAGRNLQSGRVGMRVIVGIWEEVVYMVTGESVTVISVRAALHAKPHLFGRTERVRS